MTRVGLFVSLVSIFGTAPALAQDAVLLDGDRTEGATTINVVAGDGNAQANVGVIAIGDVSRAAGQIVQLGSEVAASHGSRVELASGAFAGSRGWIALSASAGNGNRHANLALFAFGTGAQSATTADLTQTRAPIRPVGGPETAASPERSIRIGEAALADSRGLVQVSLVGGDGNTSANSFALTFEPGASASAQ